MTIDKIKPVPPVYKAIDHAKRDKEEHREFMRAYLGEWANNPDRENFTMLLEALDVLNGNNTVVHHTLMFLMNKYREEYKQADYVKYLRYGFIQFLMENHPNEVFYMLIGALANQNNLLNAQLVSKSQTEMPIIMFRKEDLGIK